MAKPIVGTEQPPTSCCPTSATLWLSLLLALTGSMGLVPLARAALLTGQVTDTQSGEALDFVNVVAILIADDNQRKGASSEEDGVYRLENLRVGTYRLLSSRIGYTTREDTVRVVDPVTRFDVRMVEDAIQVSGVDVFGDRLAKEKELQPSVIQIDREVLKSLPSIGETDPLKGLQFLPGVQAASDISTGLYIRGGGPDQTLVLVDEVPIYNPTHAFGFFSTFNGDLVDGVKLYKGAYPAEYGGRLGAVVDVQMREPESDELTGTAGLSTITSRLALEGRAGDRGNWILGARRTFLEPFLNAIRNEDNEIPSYYFYDLNAGYKWSGRNGDKVKATAYSGRDNLRFDLDDDSYLQLRWGNTVLSTSYSHIFATAFLTDFSLSVSEYESENEVQIFTTPILFSNRVLDVSLRGDVTYEWNSSRRLSAGVLGSAYEFEFYQEFNEKAQVDYRKKPYDVSAFLQDDWQLGEGTRLQTGVRARYFSDGARRLLEPRISLGQRVGDDWRVKLAGGIYHQYLQLVSTEGFSAGDFYLPIDDTADPSRSAQAVLGVEYEPSDTYKFAAETYYTDLSDIVAFDNRATGDPSEFDAEAIFVTNGTGWSSGLELFADKRVGDVTGWVGYTLGYTRRTFAELNGGREFPPKYDRRHDINAILNWRRGRWTYGMAFVYGTGQAFTPASALYTVRNPADHQYEVLILAGDRNSARLLPYHRVDLTVSRDFQFFGSDAKWMFQLFNAYSRRNEWFVQYDTEDLETEPQVFKMLPLIPSIGMEVEF
ncbi:MAG: TonB-dependent receptor plug domain-containing protein [Candidatus Eisenbacteria bacterium]